MRAAVFLGPRRIAVADRPDPAIVEPTDAVVRVVLGCVCGSDLWYYRGESPHALGPIGHEFIGVVEEVGAEVRGIGVGGLVIAPFTYSDGTCAHCRAGWTSNCAAGGGFGNHGIDGGQGEAVRVPFAASTLVQVPSSDHSDETMRSLLTLSDVMCTGHHAAVSAGMRLMRSLSTRSEAAQVTWRGGRVKEAPCDFRLTNWPAPPFVPCTCAMNIVFVLLFVAALVAGALHGNVKAVGTGALEGAGTAVTLAIGLIGVMSLWLGLLKIAAHASD